MIRELREKLRDPVGSLEGVPVISRLCVLVLEGVRGGVTVLDTEGFDWEALRVIVLLMVPVGKVTVAVAMWVSDGVGGLEIVVVLLPVGGGDTVKEPDLEKV